MNKQYTIVNGELYHYGVPGMKWGKRKNRVPSADSAKVKQIRKKSMDEMTNDELKKANERLELERKYKGFTRKTNHGKKAVDAFISTAKTVTLAAGAYTVYKKYGKKVLDKVGDWVVSDISKGLKKPFN